MRYPVAIEPGSHTEAFGVVVPDLPGCFSAGASLDEAMTNAEEAITAWIEAALDAGQEIPQPSDIDAMRKSHKEYKNWVWALVKVNPAALDDTLERVNISIPRRVLFRLDMQAKEAGETRSGFIARMAMERDSFNRRLTVPGKAAGKVFRAPKLPDRSTCCTYQTRVYAHGRQRYP